MIVGAGVGSGATAKAAVAGGADFVAYYNTAVYRIRGLPTALSFLPYDNCNDLSRQVSSEVVTAVDGQVPIIAGIGAHDPRYSLESLITEARYAGADGVMNEPFISIYSPEIRNQLEAAGLGFERELELLRIAKQKDMVTLGWAFDGPQAAQLARIGVTYIGLMAGMMTNEKPEEDAITSAIGSLESIAQAALSVNPGANLLAHGGPFNSTVNVKRLLKESSLNGIMTGSNGERLPLHAGVRDAIAEYKDIQPGSSFITSKEGEVL